MNTSTHTHGPRTAHRGLLLDDDKLMSNVLSVKRFKGGVMRCFGIDDRGLNSASLMVQFPRLPFLGTLKKPVDRAALQAAVSKLA